MASAAAAVATAGVGVGTGVGLFSYNRGNFQQDAKNRYTRYTAGLNMAIAQTGMYRQDITDLTNLTVTRQDLYHVIAAMGLTILTAIYCPGRLGLHTPPPPGWLMGLAFANIAGAYMFLGLTCWLCMHAAMRADTAATHMLTRFVRLPIPSQGMLDKARKFLSSYEEQPLTEIFRIPWAQDHVRSENGKSYNDHEIDADAKRRARRGKDLPAWYLKEKSVEKSNCIDTVESMMPLTEKGNAPEHFEAYREIQQEWWPYDVYSRLSIFLAFSHMIQCWAFMQIGHSLAETRALFAGAIIILFMFVLQQFLLTLDIVPMKVPIHRLGPFALWFGYFAAAIEYKRWYTPGAQLLGFVLVYIAYAIEIIYTLWLLKICAPSKDAPPAAESVGSPWWPTEWKLPTAFQHAIWLVAPPKDLEPGLVDLAGELRSEEGQGSGRGGARNRQEAQRRDAARAMGSDGESNAWYNVRTGLLAMVVAWCFLTFGFTIEVINQGTATPALLSAPGMPNNARDPRYRPTKVNGHEPTEVGTGGVVAGPARGISSESVHRRLSDLTFMPEALTQLADDPRVAKALDDLMPYLQELAYAGQLSGMKSSSPTRSMPPALAVDATPPARVTVTWPRLFEPRLMACGAQSSVAIALSRHGRGTMVMAQGNDEFAVDQNAFILEGVSSHGPMIASFWDADGLVVMTASGTALECPGSGPTSNGRWPCVQLPGAKLPISLAGKILSDKVAIARKLDKTLQAAVLFPGEESVTVFSRASREAAPWLPSGEVSTPVPFAVPSFSARAESLLLTAVDGAVAHLHMGTGRVSMRAPAFIELSRHAWHAACQMTSGHLVRLSQGPDAPAELVVG